MSRLRVAVLEDDLDLLDRLHKLLKKIDDIQLVAATDDPVRFKERVRALAPDALFLDIEIGGQRHAGLEMAREFALPVLFISGRTRDDLQEIEVIQRMRQKVPVEHLTKPYSDFDLRQAVSKLIMLIDGTRKTTVIPLPLVTGDRLQVRLEDIVLIDVPENDKHAKGNNKTVHFTNRPPAIVANLSLNRLVEFGFPEETMLRISRSSCAHPDRIVRWDRSTVRVQCIMNNGQKANRDIPVGPSYADAVEARLKGRY